MRKITTRITGTACATVCFAAAALVTASGAAAAEENTLTADPMATWQTNGIVWSLEYARGVVYAGGTFTSVRPPGAAPGEREVPRKNFAAFDAVTGALLPCAPAMTGGAAGTVRALKASRDDSVLYVGGSFNRVNSTEAANAVALNTSNCSLRNDFRPVVSARVRAFEVTDRAVYLGGDFKAVNGQARTHVAALSRSGALLPFKVTLNWPVKALLAAEGHGKLIVGGDFTKVNGVEARALVSLNPATGSTVQTYPGWIPHPSTVQDLDHDGTRFFVAAEGNGTGHFDGRVAGNLANGAMVWKDHCRGATQAVVPYRGVLYSGSHAHDCSKTPGGFPEHQNRQHFLAQSTQGKNILHWFPDTDGGIGAHLGPRVLVMAGGILWAGGEFTKVNDEPQQALTRFSAAPDVGAPKVPSLSVASTSATKIKLSWRASWDRDDADLTYLVYRDGALLTSLSKRSKSWDRPQMSFTDSVAPSSRHRYSIRVTDGANTSPNSATVTASAAPAETGTAGTS